MSELTVSESVVTGQVAHDATSQSTSSHVPPQAERGDEGAQRWKRLLGSSPQTLPHKNMMMKTSGEKVFCMHTQQTSYLLLCFIFLNRPEVSNASVCNSIINVTLRETWRIKVEMPALVRDMTSATHTNLLLQNFMENQLCLFSEIQSHTN